MLCHCLPRPTTGGEGDSSKTEQQTRALYDILSCVRDVRKRSGRTDAMFEPLKETASLLHAFGIQLGDGVLKQMENADLRCAVTGLDLHQASCSGSCHMRHCWNQVMQPRSDAVPSCFTHHCRFTHTLHVVLVSCRWKGLKKKMLNRREQLAALQQAEAVEIRRKSDAFAERVDEFRK